VINNRLHRLLIRLVNVCLAFWGKNGGKKDKKWL